MKFVDSLMMRVKAGDGGDGCVSFRREKHVPFGGPDGGSGGDGGNVIVRGDRSLHTLLDLRYNRVIAADDGAKGKGRNMTGKSGADFIINVPFGTLIYDDEDKELLLADISQDEPEFLLALGGKGGRGNTTYVSATHRAPRSFEYGGEGEEREIYFELKLIADVGIVGYPNAGKSTFISTVSAARPKIADYPFTTLVPILGVVKNDYGQPYVIADMPGLIDGASEGAGLGQRFLRHIERTKFLLHFVDASAEESMVTRYEAIRGELGSYSADVAAKMELVVATKMDSANIEQLEEFRGYMQARDTKMFEISSLSKAGVTELLLCIDKTLKETQSEATDELMGEFDD